jgi:hypothetical protein
MRNLVISEIKAGIMIKKIAIFAIWIYLVIATIISVVDPAKRNSYGAGDRLKIFVLCLVIMTGIMIWYCLKVRCVPHLSTLFSVKELADMLDGEEFERAYIDTDTNGITGKLEVSENWVRINGYLYSKHLTGCMMGSPTKPMSVLPDVVIDAYFIDGTHSHVVPSGSLWIKEAEKDALQGLGIRSIDSFNIHAKSDKDVIRHFINTYSKVSEGRELKDFSASEFKSLREKWNRVV